MSAPKRQSKEDREYILANLPGGVRRVQVIEPSGKQTYKRPDDVDVVREDFYERSIRTTRRQRSKARSSARRWARMEAARAAGVAGLDEHVLRDGRVGAHSSCHRWENWALRAE